MERILETHYLYHKLHYCDTEYIRNDHSKVGIISMDRTDRVTLCSYAFWSDCCDL